MPILILADFPNLPAPPDHRRWTARGRRRSHRSSLPLGTSTLSRARLVARSLRDWRSFDAVLIPCFNQTLAPFIGLAARAIRIPVLLDYMVGVSDVIEDRQSVVGARVQFYRQIDRYNLRTMAAITDTQAHIRTFERLLDTALPRLSVLPAGAQPEWLDASAPPLDTPLNALFISRFIPFQGVDVILEAAALLRGNSRIHIELLGSGQTFGDAEAQVQRLKLENVTLTRGFFPIPELTARAARAAVILGVFGAVEKTQYVVPNKVFDGLAMGRAVITADSPAMREFFTPHEHFIPVTPGSPDALAAALVEAAANLPRAAEIGANGQQRIREAFLPVHIGVQARTLLAGLLNR